MGVDNPANLFSESLKYNPEGRRGGGIQSWYFHHQKDTPDYENQKYTQNKCTKD